MGLKKAISEWRNIVLDTYAKKSYSQEGEDMILNRMFIDKKTGFYIDVGAHHPMRFSNTYFFYRLGWRGLNIDAMPGSMEKFKGIRPRDINVEFGVSKERRELDYYMFNDPALNGFDMTLTKNRQNLSQYHLVGQKKIQTLPLSEILEKYLPKKQEIDFLTVDVEGLDLEVLQSNNWNKFRPKVVIVETLAMNMLEPLVDPISIFMSEMSYEFYAKTVNSAIFRLKA